MMKEKNFFINIAIVCIFLTGAISLFLYTQQLQTMKSKNNPKSSSVRNFMLEGMWSMTNKDDTFAVRLIPNANLFITDELRIFTYLRFKKNIESNKGLQSGFIFSNMLPGENHRWLRIFYYEQDKNWVMENMRGKNPGKYHIILHDPNLSERVGRLFIVTISKDGKKVIVEVPDEALVSQNYDDSLFDVTNNFFMGVHLSPNSSVEIPALNAVQSSGKL